MPIEPSQPPSDFGQRPKTGGGETGAEPGYGFPHRFRVQSKAASVAVLAFCVVSSMALWFSMTAVIPVLTETHDLGEDRAALLSSIVSVGFVCGTFASAVLGLADRLDVRRFFMAASILGAVANGAVLLVDPVSETAMLLRFVTGASLAGVYPVGMKIASTWARRDMGLLVGILTASVTLGSATPHLLAALGGVDWRAAVGFVSLLALASGLGINLISIGPRHSPALAFQPRQTMEAWRNKGVRFANLGYFGHKWENYAMWAWIGPFMYQSLSKDGARAFTGPQVSLLTFFVIGAGTVGCLAGGYLADRLGRTTVTIGALAVSGACALLVGPSSNISLYLLVGVCLVWGTAVVADSAQFSASVIELSDPQYVGTMLTVQTCIGYLVTFAAIQVLPLAVSMIGWTYAFAVLALGPLVGIFAMWSLRRSGDKFLLAGGRG